MALNLFDQFIKKIQTLPQQVAAIPKLFNPPKSVLQPKIPAPPPPPKPQISLKQTQSATLTPKAQAKVDNSLEQIIRSKPVQAAQKVVNSPPVQKAKARIGSEVNDFLGAAGAESYDPFLYKNNPNASAGKGLGNLTNLFLAPTPVGVETKAGIGALGIAGLAKNTSKFSKALKLSDEAINAAKLAKGSRALKLSEEAVKITPEAKAFASAAEHIGSKVNPKETTSLLSKTTGAVGSFWKDLKKVGVDSFSPIEDTVNKIAKDHAVNIPKEKDPRLLYNRVLGAPSIATQVVKNNLSPALKDVGVNNLKEFDNFLAARHSLDLESKGIKTGLDQTHAKTFVDTLSPKYQGAADAVTKHTQDVLKYVADNGLISQDTYNHLVKQYPNYVPMQRVLDEVQTGAKIPSKSVASLGKQTVVRKIVGSEKDIQSPLNSIINNTFSAVDQVERNRVGKALVDLRTNPGFKDIIIPTTKAGADTISVFENGQKKLYQVPKDIADTAKGMTAEQLGVLGRILQVPGRIFRATTTSANPAFAAGNLARDQFTAFLNSNKAAKTSLMNPKNFIQSFFDVIGQKGAYADYLASGGGGANYLAQGKNAYKATIQDLARSTPSKIAHTVTNPKEWLSTVENLISITENTARTQQFKGTLQGTEQAGKAISPLANPTGDVLTALKAGRQNTVDFSRSGTWGKVLNSTFVYFNPAIQGTRQFANSFKTNPVGTTFKTVASLALPTAATTLWNTSSPERKAAYDDIPQWEKNTNLIILPPNPTKDPKTGRYTGAIKIPLPQTFNGLTIPVRSAIEQFTSSNPTKALDALMQTLGNISPVDFSSVGGLVSRAVPTALQPPIENFTNTKLFTGGQVVPKSQETLSPGQQVGKGTPATVVALGQKMNTSPAMLNNLIKGYGGAVSQQILNAVDTALAKVGVIPQEKIGGESVIDNILKRFTSVTGGNTLNQSFSSVDKYAQEAKDRLAKEKQTNISTYNELQKATDKTAKFDELVKSGKINDSNVAALAKIADEQSKGITSYDKYVKTISPPERAKLIQDELSKLPTKQQKAAYIDEIATKGWLTDDTINALTGGATPTPTPAPKKQSGLLQSLNPVKTAYAAEDVTPNTPPAVAPIIVEAAKKNGVPPKILAAIAEHESGGTFNANINEYSGGQGRGMFQIDLGQHPNISEAQAKDPQFAADYAAKLLKEAYDRYGNWDDAIKAYNAGDPYSQRTGYNGQPVYQLANQYLSKIKALL